MTKKTPKDLEKLKKQAEEYLAGWQRARADLINYKKRQEKEAIEFKKYVRQEMILELLPILDSFQLALEQAPKDSQWIKGIFQIKNQLEDLLKNRGVEEIKAMGEKFNPELHEAIEKVEGKGKEGQVVEEVQKGYLLNGRVIRPSKVKVS